MCVLKGFFGLWYLPRNKLMANKEPLHCCSGWIYVKSLFSKAYFVFFLSLSFFLFLCYGFGPWIDGCTSLTISCGSLQKPLANVGTFDEWVEGLWFFVSVVSFAILFSCFRLKASSYLTGKAELQRLNTENLNLMRYHSEGGGDTK